MKAKVTVVTVVKRVAQAHTMPQTAEARAVRAELKAKLFTAMLMTRLQRV